MLGTHYNPKHESLLIQFALGTIAVTGPKTWDFYDQYLATVKPDQFTEKKLSGLALVMSEIARLGLKDRGLA